MSKKITGIILLLACTLLLTACGSQKSITIATGNKGGSYFEYGTGLGEKIKAQYEGDIIVKETPGSESNIELINSGIADIAFAQADSVESNLENAEKGSKFHILGSVYSETALLIVRNETGITSANQLAGTKIAVGEEGSSSSVWAEEIRKSLHIKKSEITFVNMTMAEGLEAIKAGEIDGCFLIMAYDNKSIKEFVDNEDVSVVGFSSQGVDFLEEETSVISGCIIPAGTYKNQSEDIITLGVPALLIASDSLDKDIENMIIQVVKENGNLEEYKPVNGSDDAEAEGTSVIKLNMYMTLVLAVFCLMLGNFLRKKVAILVKFCIPSPVVGGLIFAIVSCILYSLDIVEISFDDTFKDICMMIFFTSVGFQANLKTLKMGGKTLAVLIALVAVLVVLQNAAAIGISVAIGQSPLLGMTTGSIPMLGGHGVGGAFGPIIEGLGLEGGTTLVIAAATFGLVAGSLMGGPLAEHLIEKKNLVKTAVAATETEKGDKSLKTMLMSHAGAFYQLAIAMGIGALLMVAFEAIGLTFPMYIGGLFVAAIMRNISELTGKFETPIKELEDIGDIALSLFLGIAMITLKLWQLADLALPLIILLAGQAILMFVFARFVCFNLLGRDYDAAVITSGICGFGMGATPNAMANMQAVTNKYVPSVKAFLIVPIVGAMINDIINSAAITVILNMLK